MRFPPSFLDEIKARLPVSEVVRRRVKLMRVGREWKGLSPFTSEKTPSFFANDQKMAWFDFSAGKNGNIFDFLMETEGLSFPEAVEHLAQEAGLPLPKISPEAEAKEKARASLYQVLELAAAYFSAKLLASEGREARAHLEARGISAEMRARFRLGYAGPERYGLRDHLAAKGVAVAAMIDAGLLIHGEGIAVPYDRFRDRIIFPVCDAMGRIIAFGGRAIAKDGQPKYLNSPETALFHKGAILYNHHNARKPAREMGQLIVVEGYIDVISMTSAGFEATVAPLGTALTPAHCALLWQMAEEPVLCFDGDRAGRRAAYRAIDTALPLITPGRSFKFAILDKGEDPDDLVRSGGREAVAQLLSQAKPLSELIWIRETEHRSFATPERRARLEHRLDEIAGVIQHGALRRRYYDDLRGRFFQFRRSGYGYGARPATRARGHDPKVNFEKYANSTPSEVSLSLKASALLRPGKPGRQLNEGLILQLLLNHPGLIGRHIEKLAEIELVSKEAIALRDAIVAASLSFAAADPLDKMSPDAASLRTTLEGQGLGPVLQKLDADVTHASHWYLKAEAAEEDAEVVLKQALAWHCRRALEREVESAKRGCEDDPSEENFHRLRKAKEQLFTIGGNEATVEDFGVLSGRPRVSF
jgi:DNA primase